MCVKCLDLSFIQKVKFFLDVMVDSVCDCLCLGEMHACVQVYII